MKKYLLFLLLACTTYTAQIKTARITTPKENNVTYDSLENFVGDKVNSLIGQTLYLPRRSESLREYGYENFSDDFPVEKNNDFYDYDDIADKYYKVENVTKTNWEYYKNMYILQLRRVEDSEIFYYQYNAMYKHQFLFIVTGYYEKLKTILENKKFYIKKIPDDRNHDYVTGELINLDKKELWTFQDLVIADDYFNLCMVLKNQTGSQILVSYGVVDNAKYIIPEIQMKNITDLYGDEYIDLIVAEKVRIGMTKEMCRLAWGEPKNINRSASELSNTEQWVYEDQYLYFRGNILESFQSY